MNELSEYYNLINEYERYISDTENEYFNFSKETVNNIVSAFDLISNIDPELRDFGRFIYIDGDQNEIYSDIERIYINNADYIYEYPTFYKNTKTSKFPIKIIAVNLNNSNNIIYDSLLYLKIINKAYKSLNIAIFIANAEVIIGIKKYTKKVREDIQLSPILHSQKEIVEISNSFSEMPYTDSFEEFYISLYNALNSKKDKEESYIEDSMIKTWGPKNSYIEMIREVGMNYNLNVNKEINRYLSFYEKKESVVDNEYDDEVKYYLSKLSFISSSKSSSFDMLLDAEEFYEKTLENELEFERNSVNEIHHKTGNIDIDNNYFKDPEELLKKIKEIKGYK